MNLFDGGYPMKDDHIDPDELEDHISAAVDEYTRLLDLGHTPEEAAAIVDTMFGDGL